MEQAILTCDECGFGFFVNDDIAQEERAWQAQGEPITCPDCCGENDDAHAELAETLQSLPETPSLEIAVDIDLNEIDMIQEWSHPTHQVSLETEYHEEFSSLLNKIECALHKRQSDIEKLYELREQAKG